MTLYSGGSDYSNDKGCFLRKNYSGRSAYIRYNQANARTVNFIFGGHYDGICCPPPAHFHCHGGIGTWGAIGLGVLSGLSNLLSGAMFNFGGFSNWATGIGNNLLSYSGLTRGAIGSTGYYGDLGKPKTTVIEKEVKVEDKDRKSIDELLNKVQRFVTLNNEGKLTKDYEAQLEELKKDLNKYELKDGVETASNNKNIEALKKMIPSINKDAEEINALEVEVDNLLGIYTDSNEKPEGLNALLTKVQTKLNNLDNVNQEDDKARLTHLVTILNMIQSGKKIDGDLLKIQQVKNDPTKDLNEENLMILIKYVDNLSSSAKNQLITKLESDLGSLKKNDGSYKCSQDYTTLLKLELLAKLGKDANVGVEYYSEATDQWIKGTIENVRKDKNGKITYNVNCSQTGQEIKALWTFRQNADSKNTATIIGTTLTEDSTDKQVTARLNMNYVWNEELGCYVNENDKTTGSAN